jgi:CRISPR-associated endonuclease/helicase Cas3
MQSQNKRGFFIGLPTMATANAMYDRMKQVYRSLYSEGSAPSLILAHGARDIHDGFQKTIFDGTLVLDRSYTADEESATAQCAAWLADNSKKGLLADGCIGTIDQSLLAILQCKFQTLRLFGMMNKVVILDEVHAYDGYMNQLLCSLLEAQASIGAPVILLSATLPLTLRKKLCRAYSKGLGADRDLLKETQQYPLLTYVSRDSTQEIAVETRPEVEREVKIQFLHSVEDVQARIAKAAQQGQCVCWIRNTVGEAMEAFTRLEQIIGEGRLHLFHARFAMGDRLEIEQKVIRLFGRNSGPEERRGQVLVATQVVEQSLDLDFDVMITDLAPIDLLIQRAGRLHRHKRDAAGSVIQAANRSGGRDQPILNLLSPNLVETPDKNWYSSFFRGASFVYPSHGQLWLTAKILHDKQKWNMPADARTLIEYVYRGDQEVPRALTDRDKKAAFKENKKESAAVQNTINLESGYTAENDNPWDDLNAPTRYNEDKSLKVVLAEVVGDTILPWRADDPHPWRASELTVGSHVLADEFILGNLPPKKDILPGGGKYSTLLPLSLGSDGRFSGLARDRQGKAIRLEYSRHLGLQKRRGGQE